MPLKSTFISQVHIFYFFGSSLTLLVDIEKSKREDILLCVRWHAGADFPKKIKGDSSKT